MIKKILTFFLLAVSVISAQSQWVTYTANNTKGLCGSIVTSIAENDSDIWFATDSGIVKYDHVNQLWYNYTTTNGLPNNFVYKILWQNTSVLWAATNGGGVSSYSKQNNQWTTYNHTNGLAANIVRDIAMDSVGNMWFATYGGGLSRYNGTWQTFNTSDGLAGNLVYSLFFDSDNNLWCGTSAGVSMYNGATFVNYTTANGLPSNTITSISQDNAGNIWIGTIAGAAKYDGATWQTYSTTDGLADNIVHSIKKDSVGNMWFATHNGLSMFNGSAWTTYTTSNGLAGNEVYCIFHDTQQNYWFGLIGNGVSIFNGTTWRNLFRTVGMNSNYAYDMAEGNNGDIWFTNGYSGACKFNGTQWTNYRTNTPLANQQVTCLLKDNQGKIWFGTYNGAYAFDGTNWLHYTTFNGLPANYIVSIYMDSEGNLWMGTYSSSNNSVSKFNGSIFTNYYLPSNSGNQVSSICEDLQGRMWFSINNKIYILNGNNLDSINPYVDFSYSNAPYINKIFRADNGDMWIATGDGAFMYSNNVWTHFNEPGNSIYYYYYNNVHTICEDQTGGIWFGANNKLSRFKNNSWIYYYNFNGINPYNINKVLATTDGYLWAAHNSGVSKGKIDLLTSVETQVSEKTIKLSNFPNPFNNSTNIRFDNPKSNKIKLTIFDLYGKIIATLLDDFLPEGEYNIAFETNNLSNGIYFCELITDNKKSVIHLVKTN